MPRNPPWSREELILALDTYLRHGLLDKRHPEVAELSRLLNRLARDAPHPDPDRFRNPNGVAMKLANFAALDPSHGGMGFTHGGRGDAVIWDEFHNEPEGLAREARSIRERVAEAPEVTAARAAVAQSSGRAGGQGFQISAAVRRAVEQHAMALATAWYRQCGWQVEDVSASNSYDLLCTRVDAPDLHVEVKGTTSSGAEIIITPNELHHARERYPDVALCVVAGIELVGGASSQPRAQGGQLIRFDPWQVDDGTLMSLGFVYTLPLYR
jgi:hypothetical protein